MMTAMYQMELPPLRNRERTEDRMVENFCIRSKSRGALGHHLVHLGNLQNNLRGRFLRRQAARDCYRRRFHSVRKVSDSDHNECSQALTQCRYMLLSLVRGKYTRKTFGRSRIRQIQMFEDFSNTPLIGTVPAQLFCRQSMNRCADFIVQTFEVRVHEGN